MTTCWNTHGDEIDCAGTGQDGDLRRGEPRAYADNGDGTISDRRTALMWEKSSEDISIHGADRCFTWAEAFSNKIATLNSVPCFAGHCDWRLPNRFELETLLDLGAIASGLDPAVSPAFNTGCSVGCTVLTCSCTPGGYFWSSSPDAYPGFGGAEEAWTVNFGRGSVISLDTRGCNLVRAVRGGS